MFLLIVAASEIMVGERIPKNYENVSRTSTAGRNQIPIVCYAEDWGRLPSSTQHLMRGLSRTHPVLWVNSLGLRSPSMTKGDAGRIFTKIKKCFRGIKEVEPNIFVLSPLVIPLYKYGVVRLVNRQILKGYIKLFLRKHRFKNIIQWSSCPTSVIMLGSLGELANVYYIGDEFAAFTQFDSSLVGYLERRLLVGSDMLFVVSDRLMETKSQFNALTFKLPHGCDYEHFSKTQELIEDDIPQDIKEIPRPVIGYYGLIRDWFDFDMLRDIFARRQEWSLTLIGPSDTDTSLIADLPNVYLLGPKSYEFLPRYLRGFDVCLIPYKRNEITINANPLKFLEYLASGKPVVSTDVPAIHPYSKGVSISKTADQLEVAISAAIQSDTDKALATRQTIARENSWQNRVSQVETLFEKHIYPYRKPAEKPVVLHLIAAMDIAGAEKVVLNLLSQKDNSKYDLRVASFVRVRDGKGTDFLRMAAANDTVIDRMPMYRGWDLKDIGRLKRLIKRHSVKLLHTHGYKSDIVGVIASKLAGIPLIATSHGYTATDSKLQRNERLDRFFLRFARKAICVSDNVKESLLRAGLTEAKTVVVPNGVDFDHFAEEAETDFRDVWGVGDRELIIGSAGRLSVEKGQVDLIEAFAQLPPEIRSNCRLVIAGTGPEKDAIESTVARLGLESSVTLAGFVGDMRSFYQAIDIFCLPSLSEASPLTILEAAASSKPVVATLVGSVGSLIDDAKNGFLIEARDTENMSNALIKLIDDADKRNKFGMSLRDKLCRDYDVKHWARIVFDVYDEILSHRK